MPCFCPTKQHSGTGRREAVTSVCFARKGRAENNGKKGTSNIEQETLDIVENN